MKQLVNCQLWSYLISVEFIMKKWQDTRGKLIIISLYATELGYTGLPVLFWYVNLISIHMMKEVKLSQNIFGNGRSTWVWKFPVEEKSHSCFFIICSTLHYFWDQNCSSIKSCKICCKSLQMPFPPQFYCSKCIVWFSNF